MINSYNVNLTTQAQEQMREIISYISQKLESPTAASNLINIFKKSFDSLSYLPYRFPLTKESSWRNLKIHKMPVKNFFIYFWVDENKKIVHIISIIYSKRNQQNQLLLIK